MTGVRTSEHGLSMLLIPRGEGVETKIIKTAYSHSAGTAQVTFDHVLVRELDLLLRDSYRSIADCCEITSAVEYLLGVENDGLKVILSNFNHERFVLSRFMRPLI